MRRALIAPLEFDSLAFRQNLEDSVQGAQTDLKSVAIDDESVRVRFLYLPPSLQSEYR